MRFKVLGRTGLRVSELCLGAMMFGKADIGATERESLRILERFAEAGGNFIDTANIYAGGESERIVGRFVRPDRSRWVVATKYACSTRPDDPNAGGTHRKNLVQSLEASLSRLGTDYIDLYWVHMWDMFTPVEEVVAALDDAVRSGKVRYVGLSDTPAWLVSRAVTLAELRGWSRLAGIQVPYSLIQRTVERELLPMAAALDLSVAGWAPLGGGLLTGRYGSDRRRPTDTRLAKVGGVREARALTERNLAIADAVNRIAEQRGASPSQVAVSWVRAQRFGPGVIPIVGARTLAQLDDNLAALGVDLTDDELKVLDEVSEIELGFPHDFVAASLAYGDTLDLVDGRRLDGRAR